MLTNKGDSFTLREADALNPRLRDIIWFNMFKSISLPSSFSLIRKGKVYLLLKKGYKEDLLHQGIEDLKTFLETHLYDTRYFKGRTSHPSIPIQEGKRMVIRQYRHGGLLRAVTRHLYVFGSRPFRELALTEEVRACGIPTIEPIGAIHQKIYSLFYKAYLLTLELPGAVNLIQFFQQIGSSPSSGKLARKRAVIRSTANLIRNFHQAGFFHRDLQLKNILARGDQVLLIDFDRSYRKPVLSERERMKNIFRLNRSAEKWKQIGLPITRTDQWRFFKAYAGEDERIKARMKKALGFYSLRSFLYRSSWIFERMLGGRRG